VDSLRDELDEIRRTCFTPKKEQRIWEWIEENCKLPPESGAKLNGPINTGVTNYTRGFYEAYANNSVRFITLAKSAQVGGTMILKTWCYRIENKLGLGLYVTANEKMAKQFNDRELEPHFHIALLRNS